MFAEWFRASASTTALDRLGLATTAAFSASKSSQDGLTELLAQYSVPLGMVSRGHSFDPAMGYRLFELFTPGVVTTLSPAPDVEFFSSALCGLAETLWDAAVGLNGKRGDCMFMLTPRSDLVSEALSCAQACKKALGDASGLVRVRLDGVLFCCLLMEGVLNDSEALQTAKVRFQCLKDNFELG